MFEKTFKTVCSALTESGIQFAVAGTVAAQLYRDTVQATANLSFLVAKTNRTIPVCLDLIKAFDLLPFASISFENDFVDRKPYSRKDKSPPVLTGRSSLSFSTVNLGFIFPDSPWCENALFRAQLNKPELNGILVPVLTVEDVLISKLYNLALASSPLDEDDLIHILITKPKLDLIYLCGEMNRLNLPFPREFNPNLPEELKKMSSFIRKTQEREPAREVAG